MRLPYMNYAGRATQEQIAQFQGLDCRTVIAENEFLDMKNMTSDYYPAIGTRKGRGSATKTLAKPNGIFYKNGLMYVDGTALYYKDQKVGTVADTEKTFVGMGAYVLICPDKAYYNTHTFVCGPLVKTFQQSGTATFAPLSEGSAFTKISAAGLSFEKFDSVTISGCTNADFNKTTVIQEAGTGYIVVTAAITSSFTQASGLQITRAVPDMDFVCESDNRLWGCSSKNHEIYASKLGDPFNWNNFEGISTDSYAVTVGSDGDFTGCIAHLGNVLFFKENTIHKMYGSRPANFQLNTYTLPGAQKGCEKSICIVNETLYYKARSGVVSYDGSTPIDVSETLPGGYTEAAAGQYNGKYYVSMKNAKGTYELLVYDPRYRFWHKEDTTQIWMAAYGEGTLYYIDGQSQIRIIAGGEEPDLPWMLESGQQMENTMNMKYISKIMLHLQMEKDAKVEIYLKYDSDPLWERKATIRSTKKKSYMIPIIPRRCIQFQYRLVGKGNAILYGISKFVEKGSELNGGL